MTILLLLGLLVIAVLVLLTVDWAINKFNIGHEENRMKIAIGSTVVLTPVIFYSIFFIILLYPFYYSNQSFNKLDWDNKHEERYKMSADLIKNNVLFGKTKQEVIELLGDEEGTIRSHLNTFTYYLGFVPGPFSIDPDVLVVYFRDGKVWKVDQRET